MKLSLRQEQSCAVLDIEGNIDAHGFAVLKAGLSKLFQNGKNRIVVNIKDAEEVSADIIRELAILDVFARELSGKLVLVSDNPSLKTKVTTFAKPPVVAILPTVPKAVGYLEDLDSLEGDEGGESLTEITALLEAEKKKVAALEAQLKQMDPSALQKLKAENAEFKDKVKLLESQVADLAAKRTIPSEHEGFMEKIEALEDSLRKLSGEKAAQAGAKH